MQTFTAHHYPVLIDESYLDFLGHMNNIGYLQIFEKARWQMITERGYGLQKMNELKQGPVILRIDIQFKKEVRLRAQMTVESQTLEYSGKYGKIRQRLLSESNEVHCEAELTIGLFDLKERRLAPASEAWLKACGVTD
jgi:thioesterase III